MIELNTSKEILKMLSDKMERERLEQNISQKELALRANISYGTYRNFLDIQKISLLNFISIFHVLGLYRELATLTNIEKTKSIKELKENAKVKKRIYRSQK
ncbi:MAG TPA: helix-turn-helix domain-containing protein [Sulfurovum sp.]|nr:helix-turn-helix domain-containing protein [Sulfurovum sp.]